MEKKINAWLLAWLEVELKIFLLESTGERKGEYKLSNEENVREVTKRFRKNTKDAQW